MNSARMQHLGGAGDSEKSPETGTTYGTETEGLCTSHTQRPRNWWDMEWAKPKYAREQVNAAARGFLGYDAAGGYDFQKFNDYVDSLVVINNWRTSHSYPLNTFQIILRRYAHDVCKTPLVAQRTKRLKSIELKLRLQERMKLTQMQDIAGCRAVVTSVAEVKRLATRFAASNLKHEVATVDDYIAKPKRSGYRGVHLVYRYFSDKKKTAVYNGLKVELQLRSQFQHAWATAVETVGAFTKQALKSSIGEPDWLRFFVIMGTEIALREGTAPVPNSPSDPSELRTEIGDLAAKLDVAKKLNAYRNALSILTSEQSLKGKHLYLLELDPIRDQLSVTGFGARERQLASERYLEAEKKVRENPKKDAVLVSVSSVSALKRAYPNYFADTRVFLQLLEQAVAQRKESISVGDALRAARSS